MSVVKKAIAARLAGSTALTGLLGSSTHITPSHLPQSPSMPAVTYSQVTGSRVSALTEDKALANVTMQVSCWGDSYGSVSNVADHVRKALVRWSSSRVVDVFLEQEVDLPFDDDTGSYHIPLDFRVWYCST